MPRLLELKVKGFQSLADDEELVISFERLTLLCGPNSVGKSAFIDALTEIKRRFRFIAEHPLGFDSALSNIGMFDWDTPGGTATFEITVDVSRSDLVELEAGFSWDETKPIKTKAQQWYETAQRFLEDESWFDELPKNQFRLGVRIGPDGILIKINDQLAFDIFPIGEALNEDGQCYAHFRYWSFRSVCNPTIKVDLDDTSDEDAEIPDINPLGSIVGIGNVFAEKAEWVGMGNQALYGVGEGMIYFGPFSSSGTGISNAFAETAKVTADDWNAQGEEWVSWKTRELASCIEGCLLLAEEFELPTHVMDDRRLLDSKNTYYTPLRSSELSGSSTHQLTTDPVISAFIAEHVKFKSDAESKGDLSESPSNKLNERVRRFMPSLKNHPIHVETIRRISDRQEYELQPEYRVWAGDRGFEDVGSGVSYCAPVLMAMEISGPAIVQQPELHLHPSAQCELGDVFVSAFVNGKPLVIETHSEHLILRILRRMREQSDGYLIPKELKIHHSDVQVLYFRGTEDGTRIHRIRVDEDGDFLDPWPNGFFSEREAELFPDGLSS